MYPFGDLNPYLKQLGFAGNFVDFPNTTIPVFVITVSSNRLVEVQAQIQNLHSLVFPRYKHLKFRFYDVGLSETEKEMMKKHCRCEYRSFPYEKYPEHLTVLNGYTFNTLKPLSIQVHKTYSVAPIKKDLVSVIDLIHQY